jgi:hypothetical protein
MKSPSSRSFYRPRKSLNVTSYLFSKSSSAPSPLPSRASTPITALSTSIIASRAYLNKLLIELTKSRPRHSNDCEDAVADGEMLFAVVALSGLTLLTIDFVSLR